MRTTPDLLLEVGCEELPAIACREAESQLAQLAAKALADAGLEAAEIHVHVAPRRLVVRALGVPAERPAVRREQRGPKVDAPEQARAGFARKHGVAPGALDERDGFLWATMEEPATPAAELLREVVPAVVGRIQFSKTMRWDGGRFSRPVRWLVCKLDEQLVDVELFGLRSGGESRGHRFLGGEARIGSASSYLEDVRGVRVVADAAERRELITEGLDQGGEWIDPMGKLDEVTYLVEWPVVLEGSFDERYLLLPPRVPITAMQSHQRYFPVAGEEGGLAPRFLFVANGALKPEIVIGGNEEVLVGRLEDASFAYERDLDRGIEAMLAELGRVSFLEGGGSLADKTARVGELAEPLCDRNEAGEDVRMAVLRAAELCKADLVSRLVSEFSDLQGYAGSVYARQAGEPEPVCAAVEEHYMPVDAGGALPPGEAGALLSVADKVDTIAVAFALGHQPTGSRDPYGPRRGGYRAGAGLRTRPPGSAGDVGGGPRAPGAGAQAQAAGGGAGRRRVHPRPGGAGAAGGGRHGGGGARGAGRRPRRAGAAGGARPGAAGRPRFAPAGVAARRVRPMHADRDEVRGRAGGELRRAAAQRPGRASAAGGAAGGGRVARRLRGAP